MREQGDRPEGDGTHDVWYVVAMVAASAVGSLMYTLLMHHQLGHSAALFLGIPVALAVLLGMAPKAESVTGGIVKGMTFALLIAAPLLREGFLCILFASPLFYLVGIIVGRILDWQRRKEHATLRCAAVVLLLPMCLEGVSPRLSFQRLQEVTVRRVVVGDVKGVEERLAGSPRIGAPLPWALRLGFPVPLAAWGSGLAEGDTRVVHFSGAEGQPPGDLVLRVAERRPGYVRFAAVSDDTKVAHWVRWRSSEVSWRAMDAGHTEVTWRVEFERQLDPAWYFNMWERGVVHEAARYLIEANATPEGGR